jgi:nicotinamide phosphoribosyltransferase
MNLPVKEPLSYSLITDTDSYKFSHWNQYPPRTTQMMSYFESRGGPFEECTLFGLQYLMHEFLTRPITEAQVNEAAGFAKAHGVPFNYEGWMYIVNEHQGRLPVRIRAIDEGTVVPVQNALLTIESLDPKVFWIVSWLETMLVRLWYPSTIAMTSRESKKTLLRFLEISSENPQEELPFKLHDFGARGVSSLEQSRLGGAAHLLSFQGSDTVEGIRMANHYYDSDMAGYSIPAAEHSTMTMWGQEREYDAFENFVQQYITDADVPEGVPKLAACVSDSYDFFRAVDEGWGGRNLHDLVKTSGGCLVIRPDSGDPEEVLLRCFEILEKRVGMSTNEKGFKVLPSYYRVIQGDGIDRQSMNQILETLTKNKISTSNIAFGSGGGLLQTVNRDTQKWAFKCCAARVNGEWVDVRKNPATDSGKRSKAGRLDLIIEDGAYRTVVLPEDVIAHPNSVMNTVFQNGQIMNHTSFEDCRQRMAL